MKKTIFFILILMLSISLFSNETKIDSTLADDYLLLANTWGVLKYLHPNTQNIDWNETFIKSIKELKTNNSDISKITDTMIRELGDTFTYLATDSYYDDIDSTATNSLDIKKKIVYLKLNDYDNKADLLINEAIKLSEEAKGIIIDIRHLKGTWGKLFSLFSRNKLIENLISGEYAISTEKYISYNGYPNEKYYNPVYKKSSVISNISSKMIKGIRRKNEIPIVVIINKSSAIPENLINLAFYGKVKFVLVGDTCYTSGILISHKHFDLILHLSFWHLKRKTYKTFINKKVETLISEKVLYQEVIKLIKDKDKQPLPTFNYSFEKIKPDIFKSINGFPEEEERILALSKLYTVIKYFDPHQELMKITPEENFKKILPEIISASDSLEYNLALAKFVSNLNDSHGFVDANAFMKRFFSAGFPFELYKLGDKYYISKLYDDNYSKTHNLRCGDEILSINGKPLKQIFNEVRDYISNSNKIKENYYVTNRMLNGYLKEDCSFKINQNGTMRQIILSRIPYEKIKKIRITRKDTIKVFNDSLLYVNLDLLKINQIEEVIKEINDKKALIFDMRGYPNAVIWKLAPFLTDKPKAINGKFATPIFNYQYFWYHSMSMLTLNNVTRGIKNKFKIPIVVLMDEKTQSQAEYTCSVLKELANATLIGRQTSGADGEITNISLPGDVFIRFSGMDVMNRQGKSQQGVGLLPDIKVDKTLQDIKTGKDEILEKAIEFLNGKT